MKYPFQLSVLILCLFSSNLYSQKHDIFKQINQDVWVRFYHAFDSLDHKISEEIHAKDVIRIPANQNLIIGYKSYMAGIQESFNHSKEKKETRSIELRFFERLANDSIASERGIYKFILNKSTDEERTYYGQFHVLLVKRDGKWKILMDYDSNKHNTIDEYDFKEAFAMDDLSWLAD